MNEPWTAGPWRFAEGEFNTPDSPPESQMGSIRNAEGWFIAGVEIMDESEANARLIAAAPEMAELLGDFYVWAATRGNSNDLTDRARALLSRIRGEAEVSA